MGNKPKSLGGLNNLYFSGTRKKNLVAEESGSLLFTFSSIGDTNGVFYYLGATKHNSSFISPFTRGEVGIVTINGNTFKGNLAIDRNSNTYLWLDGTGHSVTFDFGILNNNQKIAINQYTIDQLGFYNSWSNNLVSGSNDNVNFTNIHSVSTSYGEQINYASPVLSSISAYRYIRVSLIGGNHLIGKEIEFYGELSF